MECFGALRSLVGETLTRLQAAGEVDSALPADYCAGALLSAAEGGALDTQTPGRVTYFYFNPGQYFKYIRPVKRLDK